MAMRKPYSNSIYQKSLLNQRALSLVNINTPNFLTNPYITQNNKFELNYIIPLFIKDSNVKGPPYNSVKILSLYIRKNRNSIEETICKISNEFETNNNLSINLILNVVNSILVLLIEKSQIMAFLNKILPILVKKLLSSNLKNLTLIENICDTIGNLIKIGGIYIRRLLATYTDDIFKNINDYKNNKNENYLFASILFLCKIIENASLFAYSKITEKPNFNIFTSIIDNFKDSKYEVRFAVGELIKQFNHMLINRDYKTKYAYEQIIYYKVFDVYKKDLKDNNNIPNNLNIILGFIEVLRNIYISEPLFLKNEKIYVDLVSRLMKCRNSKNTQIRVEFFKFIPELYQINKEIFTKKYIKDFFEYCNKNLTLKANNEIRNALFVTLGSLSLYVKKEQFDICTGQLINLLNSLIMEKKIFDVEIFKCLADLLNNKENFYMEIVVTKFNIYFILSKLFKSGLTTYKIEFLISIMTAFSSFSMQHITTVIASLNVVSLILWDEDFKIENFYKEIDDKIDNFIDPKLDGILVNIRKHIRKYMSTITNINENNDNENQDNIISDFSSSWYNKCKCLNDWRVMIFALTLFSQIENNLFLKDMLIFYNDKILPFLLFSSNKIKKKILELILCKFVKIYTDDINYSNYILNNIIDSIRNLIFSVKDIPIRIFAFNILHKKPILLDIILKRKEFFFSKLIGLLSTDEDLKIKEKLIQTIGILAKRSENKNFFITFVKKNINNILFTMGNCEDIIHKENLIFLLLYYTLYLKDFYDLKLIKQIIEALINLNINYEYQGIIFIYTLKIVNELFNTDIINNNFMANDNKKINQFCHILLIICVNNLKEGGDNTTKTEIILKVLYQIVKFQKINIYKDINTNIISESLDYFDANCARSSISLNNKIKRNKSSKNANKLDIDNNQENNQFNKKENNINDNYKKELLSNIKTDEKINLMDILFQCIIKGLSDESLKTIMNIFGLSGAMDPSEMEKSINQDISNFQMDGNFYEQDYYDDNEFKLLKYNVKTKMNEEINLSNIEPSTYKPILLILKILKENSQQDLTGQIINSFKSLIDNLEQKHEKLIEIILLTIIQVIPQVDINYQALLLSYISIIMKNFKIKIKNYLSELVKLSKDFIYAEQCTVKCCNILNYLFDNFTNEMEIYYPILIPIFLSFLNSRKKAKKEKKDKTETIFIKFFISMAKNPNVISYLNIILDELSSLFLMTNEFDNNLLDFFNRIVSLNNTYYFYPIIINTIIEKLNIFIKELGTQKEKQNKNYLDYYFIQGSNVEENKKFLNKIIDIFKKMNQINREHFITFLPTIVRYLKGLGLIKYINYEKDFQPMIIEYSDYNFISIEDFQYIVSSQICFINCIYGFNIIKKDIANKSNQKSNTSIRKSTTKSTENSINQSKDAGENSITTKKSKKNIQFLNSTNKNRKNSINNDLIIKTFDTSNCVVEEDWQEWFKSTTKILFDQSPSNTLFYCRFIADYYFPLIIELYNYAFFLAYVNNNDQSKIRLTNDLQNALQNPKTPNEILLTILNLAEFIERRNVNMIFFDYNQFGEVAYKCRAFAKALYYKENNFIIKNDFDDIEDLIELYYELKLPESAIGLLKLTEKNKDKIRKRNSINNHYDRRSLLDSNIFTENNHASINFDKKDKDKEYIWYIKMHNYNEALDIIIKQLEKEKNKKNINILKKNKDICLNGLNDWEQLLSSNDNNLVKSSINDNNKNIDNYKSNEDSGLNLQEILDINELDSNQIIESNSIKAESEIYDNNDTNHNNININNSIIEEDKLKEDIEKEILLSKACMNLGEWSQLRKHFSNIMQLFKSNNDIDEQFLINNNEDKKNDIFDANDINEDNIANSVDDENWFFINHGLSYGTNMNSLEKDFINLNKYISNYNKNKLENRSFSYNNRKPSDKNNNEEKPEIFISYKELINNNQKLNFLANNEDTLFDLNLYSTVLNIENNRYNLALKYISEGKKIIFSRIKSLLSESYIRGYELLVKNQMLSNLEQIIEYKQSHAGEKLFFENMVESWNKNLEIISPDPYIYEKFLAIRSLVLPIDQEYHKYFDLVKICRKLNLFSQSKKILLRLKNKLNIKNEIGFYEGLKMNEIQIKIELIYNKCLFEKGDKKEAIDNSRYIVDLLENAELNKNNRNNILCKLNNKLKSHIYGHYAIFKHKNFSFRKNLVSNIKEEINLNDLNSFRLSHGFFKKTSYNFGKNNLQKRKKSMRLNPPQDDESEMINHYFALATKYNNTSYRIWHNYAMFNYKYYKFIFSNTDNDYKKNNIMINNKELLFAINAVNGFKNSLSIGGKNRNKTFQDLLRLIDIFFSLGDKSDNLLKLISDTFNYIDVDAFLNVIPQLLCRFDIKDIKILDVLFNILIQIGLAHPHAIISSLIVMKFSNSKKRKSAAKMVLSGIIKKNYTFIKLIDECEMFVSELNKCGMLLHEEWSEIIEDISKTFQNKDYHSFANQMIKIHNKMGKSPKNMYEIHFFQKFYAEIKDAEEYLIQFKNTNVSEYAKEAWEIYHHLYNKILNHYKTFNVISLEYISPKLYKFEESNIVLPGTYYMNYNKNIEETKKSNAKKNTSTEMNKINNNNSIVRIRKIGRQLKLLNTKQHPRQMTMIGTDNKEYMFLLKGHEDLRQDERVMQLFDLVNTILAKDNDTYQKKLFINTYAVFPLSHNAGIIGWVPNCDTLHQLIKDQRTISNTIPSVEHRKVYKLYPRFESGNFLSKVEVFKEALNETYGTELNTIIWKKSKNCETWLNRRTNYSRSLAVMSMVGYILGLGDRHPSNLMMSRKTGKIIHIDFGDCFEVAMKRDKFPEKVPFRLTRMLIKALEVSGIEGTFRLICIKIMELLRYNKDSLLAILGSFIHDPLISFRLMIPMIMKKRKREIQKIEGKKDKNINKENVNNNYEKDKNIYMNLNNDDSNNEIINIHYSNNNIIDSSTNLNIVSQSMKFNYGGSLGKLNQLFKNHVESIKKKENDKESEKEKEGKKEKEKEEEKIEDIKVDEKIESLHEEEEKKEKKKLEEDERQIFNLFEEKDEIESEELNKIAKLVLDRIQNKLSGTDFYQDSICDEKTQVDKLITQATSYENLAQSYLGWCPFW